MRVLLKDDVIVLIPESPDDTLELDRWRAAHVGHVSAPTPETTVPSSCMHSVSAPKPAANPSMW